MRILKLLSGQILLYIFRISDVISYDKSYHNTTSCPYFSLCPYHYEVFFVQVSISRKAFSVLYRGPFQKWNFTVYEKETLLNSVKTLYCFRFFIKSANRTLTKIKAISIYLKRQNLAVIVFRTIKNWYGVKYGHLTAYQGIFLLKVKFYDFSWFTTFESLLKISRWLLMTIQSLWLLIIYHLHF